ncbi:flagellar protein FlaG, partial [Alteromonas australica]
KILQANGDTADNVTVERNEIALETAIEDVESFIQMQNRNLAFSIDEDTDRAVVTVRDSDSGDVIRQIPSEEVLALAERIQNLQQDVGTSVGVFIDNQV